MARLLRAATLITFLWCAPAVFAAGGTCTSGANYINPSNPTGALVTLSSLGITSCYYASKSVGSDSSYDGTQETVSGSHGPFAHIPGMAGCVSNCSSASTAAHTGFILRGGDTWTNTDLGGVNLTYGGSSTSAWVYIGVDSAWYAGSSWARPIWNCETTNCGDNSATSENVVYMAGNYLILDNMEITGYKYDGGGNIIQTYGNYDAVLNDYIHGWGHTSGSCGSGTNDPYAITMDWSEFSGEGTGTLYFGNVIDGADSTDIGGNWCFGGLLHGNIVQHNVIRYVYNGMNGLFTTMDGNLVEYNNTSTTGDHCNMISPFNTLIGTVMQISNNIVRHSGCSGGTTIYTEANCGNSCSGNTVYAFNNLLYDNDGNSDPGFSIGGPTYNYGTFYYYNNTVVAAGYCMQNGNTGTGTLHYSNFHCISSQSGYCNFAAGTCTNNGGNLLQTATVADANSSPHFDQYTASETYAYSPTAATNSTVGAGTNYASSGSFTCSMLAALCTDATYPTYNTTNHTVVMRTTNARPSSGAWQVGAYEFSSSQVQALQPPTGLQAAVQ